MLTSESLRLWRRFCRNRGAVFGLGVFVAIVLLALCANLLSPYDPLAQDAVRLMEGPSADHWLGTDSFGRDVLSRIIYGARIALIVGVLAVLLAMIVGVSLGLMAGYYGGLVDTVIMRIMDGLFAFPILILAIALMAVMGFGVRNVILAVAIVSIAPFARVTRGDVLAVREEPSIEAARLAGMSDLAIILRHVFPNVLARVGIPAAAQRAQDYPHQFSGGMCQRAMIGMGISCTPSLLIADEPTTALDVTIQAQILALIRQLATELGMAVLLVSHDLGIVSQQ